MELTMLLLDAFGVFLAATLALAVWGPDMWKWVVTHLGLRAPAAEHRQRFGFD
jgi:hypothetical protein